MSLYLISNLSSPHPNQEIIERFISSPITQFLILPCFFSHFLISSHFFLISLYHVVGGPHLISISSYPKYSPSHQILSSHIAFDPIATIWLSTVWNLIWCYLYWPNTFFLMPANRFWSSMSIVHHPLLILSKLILVCNSIISDSFSLISWVWYSMLSYLILSQFLSSHAVQFLLILLQFLSCSLLLSSPFSILIPFVFISFRPIAFSKLQVPQQKPNNSDGL